MKKRIISLDILKFICALLIVFHHFQQVTGIRFNGLNFFGIGSFPAGNLVELFFMISGFLCIYNYVDCPSICTYVYRKMKKIYPIALLSIVLMYVIEIINYFVFGHPIKTDGLGIWTIFSSATLTFSMGFVDNVGIGINNPLWYLSVLILCYILFYFINKSDKKFLFIIIPIVMLGFYSCDINLPLITHSTLRGYISFFIGILIFYFNNFINDKFNMKKVQVLLSIILLLISYFGIVKHDQFFDCDYYIYVVIVWPMMLLFTLYLNKFINNEKICLLGNISLEMYVWHSVLLNVLTTLYRFGLVSYDSHPLLLMISFSLFTILFSFIFVKYIEKYVNIVSQKFINFFKK